MQTRITSSRKIYETAEAGALLLAALALSFVESIIPIMSLIPIPGFKLGLANMAVIVAFYRLSPLYAAAVSVAKVIITSLLFSGLTSFVYSLSGAVLSFLVLLLFDVFVRDKTSYIGLSAAMAYAHNVGQLASAMIVMHTTAVAYYFPALSAAALVCGIISGIILCLLPNRLFVRKV